jgi:hypothetical protein
LVFRRRNGGNESFVMGLHTGICEHVWDVWLSQDFFSYRFAFFSCLFR